MNAHLHERGAARVLVMDYCLHFGKGGGRVVGRRRIKRKRD